MSTGNDEPADVVFLGDPIRTPPFSTVARRRVGMLLRLLQDGESIGMPISRPMPSIGPRCHELRVSDGGVDWRVFYQVNPGQVAVIHAIAKTSKKTPKEVIRLCKKRVKDHTAR